MVTRTILHVITGLGVGGAERSLHALLSSGLNHSYEHHVVSLTGEGHYGKLLRAAGIGVYALEMEHTWSAPREMVKLLAMIRRLEPDLIQGWMYHGNLAASVACAIARVRPKLIWSIRTALNDLSVHKRRTQAVIRLGAAASGNPHAIVYNSAAGRQHHELMGYKAANGLVIPNGFDLNKWKPDAIVRERVRDRLGIPATATVVGFVGRFNPVKDIPNFYTALRLSMERNRELHCIVLGRHTDARNPEVACYIRHLPPQRVHFLGQQKDPENIIPSFDFLCLSSVAEGFPNVVGETMACGIPCVVTDVGDAALVVGETGMIVPARNSEALSQAIDRMTAFPSQEREALGRAARVRISEKYALSITTDRYNDLYRDLITDNNVCAE